MNCPKCGKTMREGYLFTSKDGAFSFANTVPGVFENAKNADGFVEITPLKPSHRVRIQANICEDCRTIVFDY
ncbi:MAG: PF20097 family protein [Oscillospiraceae bacterium]|nr:PF20097 family protein [Oscillospiraceae bacterium]